MRSPLRLVAAVIACGACLSGCAGAAGDDQNQAITGAVSALTFPDGWAENGSVQVACVTVNLDCQEPSARRVPTLDASSPAAACEEVVAWVAATPDLVSPTALRGSEQVPLSGADCVAELSTYSRWSVRAAGPTSTGDATWSLLLTPSRDRMRFSVVLGSPPSSQWPPG